MAQWSLGRLTADFCRWWFLEGNLPHWPQWHLLSFTVLLNRRTISVLVERAKWITVYRMPLYSVTSGPQTQFVKQKSNQLLKTRLLWNWSSDGFASQPVKAKNIIGKLFSIQHLWTSPHRALSLPSSSLPRQPSRQSDFSTHPHMGLSFISPIWCHPTQLQDHPLINKARVSWLGVGKKLVELFIWLFLQHSSLPSEASGCPVWTGLWTPTVTHMDMHMYTHLHKAASIENIGWGFFFRNNLF